MDGCGGFRVNSLYALYCKGKIFVQLRDHFESLAKVGKGHLIDLLSPHRIHSMFVKYLSWFHLVAAMEAVCYAFRDC